MTLPAAIRINTNAPFPAMVTGANGIAINKQNGIWTVSFNINSFGTQVPPPANYPNDYILVYDAVTNTYFKMPLSAVATGATSQRSVTSSPIVVAAADMILNINITSGSPSCTLPAAATRAGVALLFIDVGGQFGAHPLTITPAGAETITGLASVTLSTNFQFIELTPFNDGVNAGWMITG